MKKLIFIIIVLGCYLILNGQNCCNNQSYIGNYEVYKNESKRLKEALKIFHDTLNKITCVQNGIILINFWDLTSFSLVYLETCLQVWCYCNLNSDILSKDHKIIIKVDTVYLFASEDDLDCIRDSLIFEGIQSIYKKWVDCISDAWRSNNISFISQKFESEEGMFLLPHKLEIWHQRGPDRFKKCKWGRFLCTLFTRVEREYFNIRWLWKSANTKKRKILS